MPPPSRQARETRSRVTLWKALLLVSTLLIGVTPLTATALLIYESAPNGPLARTGVDPSPYGDPPAQVVNDQSLGVKFYVSAPVTTGSIGGYFAPFDSLVAPDTDITGAIVRLSGYYDFPNSFDLTTRDVLGKTNIQITTTAGNYAGDLSLTLTGGWYALVFAATGGNFSNFAIMPRMVTDIGDPMYFFGRTTTEASLTGGKSSRGCSGALEPRGLRSTKKKNKSSRNNCGPDWWNSGFEYLNGGGLGGVRMFVDSAPAAPVPEPSTLLLLGSGLVGLGGVAWRRRRQT